MIDRASPLLGAPRAAVRAARLVRADIAWRLQGRPLPLPPHIKRGILRRLAARSGVSIFVETGTYFGDTVDALQDAFETLHSIELSDEFYRRATRRFAGNPKVRLWHGDSGDVLADVLTLVDRPALFWLDGHYSGGATALGKDVTPILRELRLIAGHFLRTSHLVVVDDARLFDGTGGYPTMQDLQSEARRLGFGGIEVANDMIVLHGT